MFCCFKWNSYQVDRDPNYLAHIPRQSYELCHQAVNKDPFTIRHVKLQGLEYEQLCLLAIDKVDVSNVVDIWKLLRNPSETVMIRAVTKCPYVYKLFNDPSDSVAYAMVESCPKAICLVKSPSEELCKLAVKARADAISEIKTQTEDLCIMAVKECACHIQYVKVHTVSVYVAALSSKRLCQDGCLFQHTNEALMSLAIKQAVKINPIIIQYVSYPEEDKNTEPDVGIIPNYYFRDALAPHLQCTREEYIDLVLSAIECARDKTETILEYVLDRNTRESIRRLT